MRPLVSIIIPLYNSEKYISETIHSALNQTWSNKEIIIVDDGSTDDSLKIAKDFAATNAEIVLLQQPNKGASAARNAGLKKAHGDYIQFLDSDDLLSPSKIEKQVIQLCENTNHLSICSNIYFNTKTDLSSLRPTAYDFPFYKESRDPIGFLMKLYGSENDEGGMITIHSWLTPVHLITEAGEWDERLTTNDDGEFFCRVVLASGGIMFQKDAFSYYRKPNDGISLSARKDIEAIESQALSLALIEEHLKKKADPQLVGRIFARHYWELGVKSYPKFMAISNSAIRHAKKLGYNGQKYRAGKLSTLLSRIFGWQILRIFSYLKHGF